MGQLPVRTQALASRQDGVISRRQLLADGATASDLRSWLRHRHLVVIHPGVYVTHTGEPTWRQRAWAAVLWAEPSVLHGRCALVAAGVLPILAGRPIEVAVDARRTVRATPGGVVRRVRDHAERSDPLRSPPRARIEEAALDHAASATDDHTAVAALAAVVGSRHTTATRVLAALDRRSRIPRRAFLADVLADVANGACSVLERGYVRDVERAHGLPTARRQVRASGRGTVYRDVEYEEFGLIVELDGRLGHTGHDERERDLARDLDAAGAGKQTLRLGWGHVLGRACATAHGIGTVLRRRGWQDSPTRCPRCA